MGKEKNSTRPNRMCFVFDKVCITKESIHEHQHHRHLRDADWCWVKKTTHENNRSMSISIDLCDELRQFFYWPSKWLRMYSKASRWNWFSRVDIVKRAKTWLKNRHNRIKLKSNQKWDESKIMDTIDWIRWKSWNEVFCFKKGDDFAENDGKKE